MSNFDSFDGLEEVVWSDILIFWKEDLKAGKRFLKRCK